MTIGRPGNRGLRVFRRMLLIALVAALTLGSIEGAYRLYLRISGEPYTGWKAQEQIRGMLQSLTRKVEFIERDESRPEKGSLDEEDILHPYLGYDTTGNVQGEAEITDYFAKGKMDERYDILVLGGSVSGMFCGSGTDELIKTLSGDPRYRRRSFHVIGRGRGGYKEPQQLIALQYYLSLGWHPSMVIFVDGFNEVALGAENLRAGVHPLYPSYSHWSPVAFEGKLTGQKREIVKRSKARTAEARAFAERALSQGWANSAVLGRLALAKLNRFAAENYKDTEEYFKITTHESPTPEQKGPPVSWTLDQGVNAVVQSWVECSLSAAAMCRARAIQFVHVLQPNLLDAGSKPLTELEIRRGAAPPAYADGVRAGYPLLREAGRKLVDGGVLFVDCTGIFKNNNNDIYMDNCHFNAEGNRIMGEFVARAVLAR
jgi:hypothetical protein